MPTVVFTVRSKSGKVHPLLMACLMGYLHEQALTGWN